MTGPEHYREAERLLARAADSTTYDEAAGITAQAQVHATLALAAATAIPADVRYYGPDSTADREWAGVLS